MYKKEVLGLEEAKIAVRACIEEASKDPSLPVAVAVTDDAGNLICFERMDGSGIANSKITTRMAINKAYTAIMVNRHTRDFKELNKIREVELATWGDPAMTTVQGGLVFKNKAGQVIGAIGVSGLVADEDEKLAYVGLNAVKL